MRYSREHKRQTRARMVQTASQHFRQAGYDGVSIGDLMAELELTHGGFYRHFPSKQSLYTAAFAHGIDEVREQLMAAVADSGPHALRTIIETYLSLEHCINPADGCPVAALSADIARQPAEVQSAFAVALNSYIEAFSPLMPGATEEERTRQVLVLFSGLAGALGIARAIPDETLRAELLQAARDFYIDTYCE